jgi:hypothetical protein
MPIFTPAAPAGHALCAVRHVISHPLIFPTSHLLSFSVSDFRIRASDFGLPSLYKLRFRCYFRLVSIFKRGSHNNKF